MSSYISYPERERGKYRDRLPKEFIGKQIENAKSACGLGRLRPMATIEKLNDEGERIESPANASGFIMPFDSESRRRVFSNESFFRK
jgi:hypothetical protein